MMKFYCVPVGILEANCYIVGDSFTKEAVVIDPGAQGELIISILERNELKVKYIFNTHCHPDHIGANGDIKTYSNAPLYIHAKELESLKHPLPLPFADEPMVSSPLPDGYFKDGDIFSLGELKLKIIETPGHSSGGVCILVDDHLITGDTLFAGTVGRTDLPGGSMDVLQKSLETKLMTLPDNVEIYPGHGPSSTIGQEKKYNPFCNETM